MELRIHAGHFDLERIQLITNEDRFQRYKILNPETVASK